ncbi:unnamed protein product [Symbiodinium pilosum]|uniref:Uncharacterized protein n=1 Tax=Symbiodinium pilosum TaxID=2952 RepID=A0A812KPZ5_SYMPI|nr:unnamed protein product [Symbiodinium pilosum]
MAGDGGRDYTDDLNQPLRRTLVLGAIFLAANIYAFSPIVSPEARRLKVCVYDKEYERQFIADPTRNTQGLTLLQDHGAGYALKDPSVPEATMCVAATAAVNCTDCWQGGFAHDEVCCQECPAQCSSGQCTMMHSQGYKCYDPKKEVVCDLGTGHLVCEKDQVCPSAGPTCSGGPVKGWECLSCPEGQRPDESHCRCVSAQRAADHVVDVGNRACPADTTPLTSSEEECAAAAEAVWPGRGCYGRSWKEIIQTPADGQQYPAGCMFEVAAGGGCALLFNPTGQATKCPDGSTCNVLCHSNSSAENCLEVGTPCDPKNNTCCKDPVGVPMQCVSMGGTPVCISGSASQDSIVV